MKRRSLVAMVMIPLCHNLLMNEIQTLESTNQMTAPASASSPDKRRYPWLDNDDHTPLSPSSPAMVAGDNTSLAEVQKSLLSELSGEDPGSHDQSCDPSEEVVPVRDKISLSEEESKGGGGATGSKVKPAVVIKRRNVAIYQTQDDD